MTLAKKLVREMLMLIVLSRLPLPIHVGEVTVPEEITLLLEGLQTSPVNADQIKTWTIEWRPVLD